MNKYLNCYRLALYVLLIVLLAGCTEDRRRVYIGGVYQRTAQVDSIRITERFTIEAIEKSIGFYRIKQYTQVLRPTGKKKTTEALFSGRYYPSTRVFTITELGRTYYVEKQGAMLIGVADTLSRIATPQP